MLTWWQIGIKDNNWDFSENELSYALLYLTNEGYIILETNITTGFPEYSLTIKGIQIKEDGGFTRIQKI